MFDTVPHHDVELVIVCLAVPVFALAIFLVALHRAVREGAEGPEAADVARAGPVRRSGAAGAGDGVCAGQRGRPPMSHEAARVVLSGVVITLTALVFFGLGIIAERDRARAEARRLAARKAADERAAFERIMKAVEADTKSETEIVIVDPKRRTVRFERYVGRPLNSRGGCA